jgi:hypothetical protein
MFNFAWLAPAKSFCARHLAWFFLAMGLALMAIGYFCSDHAWAKYAADVGRTALVGGVFAAIIKSYQFTTIFREIITEVIHPKRIIQIMREVSDAWKDVAADAYSARLPEISKALRDALTQRVPVDAAWYYRTYKTRMFIGLV